MATTIDLGKIRLQWKGDYDAAVSYELLDVCKFKGDSYVFISTIAAANKTPDTTSEWDLMVSGGDQWSSGTSVPTGGNPGDFYIKTDDEKVYENVAGTWTVKADVGGSRWTTGTSVPTGGESGDFYLKTDDEKVYENVSGTWTIKLDIGGGVWTSGTTAASGGESGDWYMKTDSKTLWENVSGTWTQRVDLSVSGTNLSDLANVPALDTGKFLTNDGTNASWATVDVTGAAVGGDVTGTVSNIQLAANVVTDTELNSAKLNGVSDGAEVNPTFKTVGGTSVLGSGDIATLPSQSGASGKVLKSDGTDATWGVDEGGTLKQVVSVQTRTQGTYSAPTSGDGTEITPLTLTITPTASGNKVILDWIVNSEGDNNMGYIVTRNGTRLPDTTNASNNHYAVIVTQPYDGNYDSTPDNVVVRIIDNNCLNTSSVYRLHVRATSSSSYTMYLNITQDYAQGNGSEGSLSTGTAMEIKV